MANGRIVELLWSGPVPASHGFPDWRPGYAAGARVTLGNATAGTSCLLEHIQTWSTIYDYPDQTGGTGGALPTGLSPGTYFLQYLLLDPSGTPVGLTQLCFITVSAGTPSNTTYGFPVSGAVGWYMPPGYTQRIYVTQPNATSPPDPSALYLYMVTDSTTYNANAPNHHNGYPTAANPNYASTPKLADLYTATGWQPTLKWRSRFRIPADHMVTINQSVSVSAPAGILQDAYGNTSGAVATPTFEVGGTELTKFINYSLVDSSGFTSDTILPPVDSTGKSTDGTAQVYYISSTLGDDRNTAEQAQHYATPWATPSRALTAGIGGVAGINGVNGWIAFLFRRGDVFPGGHVASVLVTNHGSGYSSAPDVTIVSHGSGSGATAQAVMAGVAPNMTVQSVTVTAPGHGYQRGSPNNGAPTVTFSGGGGSGAAAVISVYGGISSNVGGRDFAHPVVFGSYWNPADGPDPATRPILRNIANNSAFSSQIGGGAQGSYRHMVMRGLRFEFDPDGNPDGAYATSIGWSGERNTLFEDVAVIRCPQNGTGIGGGTSQWIVNQMFHRCIIVDGNISGGGNAAGLTPDWGAPSGAIISQCILDQNGYTSTDLVHSDIFSHNNHGSFGTCPELWLECILRRGGASGVQLRNGGCLAYTVMSRNALHSFTTGFGGTYTYMTVMEKAKDIPGTSATGAFTTTYTTTWTKDSATVTGDSNSRFMTDLRATGLSTGTVVRPTGSISWYSVRQIINDHSFTLGRARL